MYLLSICLFVYFSSFMLALFCMLVMFTWQFFTFPSFSISVTVEKLSYLFLTPVVPDPNCTHLIQVISRKWNRWSWRLDQRNIPVVMNLTGSSNIYAQCLVFSFHKCQKHRNLSILLGRKAHTLFLIKQEHDKELFSTESKMILTPTLMFI